MSLSGLIILCLGRRVRRIHDTCWVVNCACPPPCGSLGLQLADQNSTKGLNYAAGGANTRERPQSYEVDFSGDNVRGHGERTRSIVYAAVLGHTWNRTWNKYKIRNWIEYSNTFENGEIFFNVISDVGAIHSRMSCNICLLRVSVAQEPGINIITIIEGEKEKSRWEKVVDIIKEHNWHYFYVFINGACESYMIFVTFKSVYKANNFVVTHAFHFTNPYLLLKGNCQFLPKSMLLFTKNV